MKIDRFGFNDACVGNAKKPLQERRTTETIGQSQGIDK